MLLLLLLSSLPRIITAGADQERDDAAFITGNICIGNLGRANGAWAPGARGLGVPGSACRACCMAMPQPAAIKEYMQVQHI